MSKSNIFAMFIETIGTPIAKGFCFPMLHCLSHDTQLQQTLCGAHALSWSPNLTTK